MTASTRLPTFFVPHGGGPCFFIKPEDMPPGMPKDLWGNMAAFLKGVGGQVGRKPKAVVVATAHWLTERPTIGNAAEHELYYDYYGFPPYTYQLDYKPKGAPQVAARVAELLAGAGIASDMDGKRGLDHGVFVPFKLIYPDADVPIVPMSLRADLDPQAHIEIGRALAPLRDEDVLIVGSGMSFHNMRAFMRRTHAEQAAAFDAWLAKAATAPPAERDAALAHWSEGTAALDAHPEEEHLIPLMVAAGAAGADFGRRTYSETLGAHALSAFTFG